MGPEVKMRTPCLSSSALVIFSMTALAGCALWSNARSGFKSGSFSLSLIQETNVRLPREAPKIYRKAMADLIEERYLEALEGFEFFVKDNPVSPWTQVALLNSGRALEGLERWSEAAARYREVVVTTPNALKLQTMALYRLSFCQEALRDDPSTVATLNDVWMRRDHLQPEVAKAELPARLAAAYARAGNFQVASEYYGIAEAGIIQLRRASGTGLPEWLPQILYFMGHTTSGPMSWDEFETHLRPLGRGQVYLLQAAELGSGSWSEKSAKALIRSYQTFWKLLENALQFAGSSGLAVSEALEERRELQRQQWRRAGLLLESLYELRAHAAPDMRSLSPEAREVLEFADDLEKALQALLLERPVGEGLTPEAQRRRLRIRGQVIAPDDALERRFLMSGRDVQLEPVAEPGVKAGAEPEHARPRSVPDELPTKVKRTKRITPSGDPNL